MATIISFYPAAFMVTNLRCSHSRHSLVSFVPNRQRKLYQVLCNGQKKPISRDSASENVLLKMAWYSSELLGIAASFIRSPSSTETPVASVAGDGFGVVDRSTVVETIKEDFHRSYFVTGNLTLAIYEEDCEFADPAGSFRGLHRFKRNCSNFGLLLEKSNMKLMKWENREI